MFSKTLNIMNLNFFISENKFDKSLYNGKVLVSGYHESEKIYFSSNQDKSKINFYLKNDDSKFFNLLINNDKSELEIILKPDIDPDSFKYVELLSIEILAQKDSTRLASCNYVVDIYKNCKLSVLH